MYRAFLFHQYRFEGESMRKVLVTIVLALITVSLAQGQDKQIKDKNEYDAYIAAYNTTDPGQKAAAMEAFVKQYPQSVMLSEAMETALAGYQRASNIPKVVEMAKRLLGVNPNNVNALAIVTAVDRALATDGKPDALKEGCASAQTGLQQLPNWAKPEGASDADFAKLRSQMSNILNGMAGFSALQAKDYPGPVKSLPKPYPLDPPTPTDP